MEDTDEINDGPKNKRRRLDNKEEAPGSNTATPTVIWKSKHDQLIPPEEPIVKAGQGEKVALLKDWRERFKSQPNRAASWPESNPINRRGSQIATAVVIGNDSSEPHHSTTQPPTTLGKRPELPSRSKVLDSIPEHQHSVVNSTTPHTSDSPLASGDINSARLVRSTTTAGKKRKIEELPNHKEDELPAPKKRPGTPKKKTAYNHESSKQPLANRTNISIPASGKRKTNDPDDQSTMSPRKRTQTTNTGGVEARTSEENLSSTRRTTRRSR